MPASPNTTPRGLHCDECMGHRLHRVRLSGKKLPGAVRRYIFACTVCERETPVPPKEAPGISCPKCGDVRLRVVKTTHRTGQTVRVRRCVGCSHRLRCRETVESFAC